MLYRPIDLGDDTRLIDRLAEALTMGGRPSVPASVAPGVRWRFARGARPLLAALLVAVPVTGGNVAAPVRDVQAASHVGESVTSSPDVIVREPRHVVARDLPRAASSGNGSPDHRATPRLARLPTDGNRRSSVAAIPASDPILGSITAAPPLPEPESFAGLAHGSTDFPAGFSNSMVAAGPDNVMQTVDEVVRITDRAGTTKAQVAVVDFFGLTGPGMPLSRASDVQVVYDSLHGRWLASEWSLDCDTSDGIASVGHGYLDLAISDSSNPLLGWSIYSLGRYDRSPIRPSLGTSTDKVVLAGSWTQMIDPGPGCGEGAADATEIIAFSWGQLLAGGSVSIQSFTSGLGGVDELSAEVAFWRPAVASPSTSATIFLVGRGRFSYDGYYGTITGNPAAGTAGVTSAVDLASAGVVAPFQEVPFAMEPDAGWTLGTEAGATSAIWQSGRLAFVSGHPCKISPAVSNRVCVRVTELVTGSASPSRRQDFLIGESAADNFGGGIAYSGTGDLHVVWARSSEAPGDYPSSFAAYQRATDPPDSISAPQLLAAGTATFASTVWALRIGLAPDPLVPSAVWQGNIYSVGATFYASHVSRLQTPGTTYVPITPVRVLDTRNGVGLSGKFTNGTARTFAVTGVGVIPANAVAVTGNVTVTQQNASGFVAVTPTATNNPPSSSINFPVGDNRANNLAVALSSTGTLSATYKAATAGKTTQLIFDVTGYFLADDTGATLSTITPTRVLDTRNGTGLTGLFLTGVPRTLQITGGIVPLTATAITGNLTVTQQSASGYLAVTQTPTATPATSTLNFPVSDNRANGVYAPLDIGGALSILYKSGTAGAHTQVILDITGYFEPGTGGLRFVPLNPARIMDTRTGLLGSQLVGLFHAGTSRLLGVDGHWGVPAGAEAISGNLTVTGQTGSGYVVATPAAPPPNPATSTINFPLGDTRANGLVTPLNGSGDTYLMYVGASGKTTNLILDLSGYFE
jgi:hypothetical protein